MKNTVVYIIIYLILMLLTYLWRISGISAGMQDAQNMDTIADITNWCLLINYILMAWVVYARGKAIDKKYIITFPIVAGVFDILLPFIPFVPTIMNIITIVVSVSAEKEKVIYVEVEKK